MLPPPPPPPAPPAVRGLMNNDLILKNVNFQLKTVDLMIQTAARASWRLRGEDPHPPHGRTYTSTTTRFPGMISDKTLVFRAATTTRKLNANLFFEVSIKKCRDNGELPLEKWWFLLKNGGLQWLGEPGRCVFCLKLLIFLFKRRFDAKKMLNF